MIFSRSKSNDCLVFCNGDHSDLGTSFLSDWRDYPYCHLSFPEKTTKKFANDINNTENAFSAGIAEIEKSIFQTF